MAAKDYFGMLAGGEPFGGGPKNLKKQIDELIKNRPQYSIQDEAFENQALAKNQAFGRDRGIQQAESNIMANQANAVGQAQQVSNSTNALLGTVEGITGNVNNSLRSLGVDEANVASGRMRDLYGANNAMIDEKDKEWNFNVNEPYQNQIQELRNRRKAKQENFFKILDTIGGLGVSAAAGGAFGAGGTFGKAMG